MATQTIDPKAVQITGTEQPRGLLDRIVEQQRETASRYQPVMSIQELIEREKAVQYLVDNVMLEGVDYGWIPGTRPKATAAPGEYQAKPTLFKAGAERACAFFGYVPSYVTETCIEEWDTAKYGEMLFYYRYECTLTKNGHPIGSGIGSATTFESKYRYRSAERVCPGCGQPNIRKSKPKPGQRPETAGFYCWEKTGGCGATFAADDETITGQETGRIPNPDVADVVNTVQKMAQKRAYVAATLTATGLSGRFTQDLEEMPPAPQQAKPATPSKPVPKPLEAAFKAIDKGNMQEAFAKSCAKYADEFASAGAGQAYDGICDKFVEAYPKGTNDREVLKSVLLQLHEALDVVLNPPPVDTAMEQR